MSITKSIVIRAAQENDREQLYLLFEEFLSFNLHNLSGVSKTLLSSSNPKQFAVSTIDGYFADDSIFFVAEELGIIRGYICGNVHIEPHLEFYPEAEIIDWFVSEAWRSKGLGIMLYKAFLEAALRMDCKSLSVEAFSQNADALNLYHHLGFSTDSIVLKQILI